MSDVDPRIGQVIGERWRIERELGKGAMATVYAVRHRNGSRAALKVLHMSLSTDEGAIERFKSEATLANASEHPGITKVIDDGETKDGCPYLVMELLEGMTLEQLRLARGGYVAPEEVMELAKRLLDVLVSVHEAQVIHRDLKPTNVFLTNDGQLKLLDFGLARSLLSGARAKSSVLGMVMGTPSFMSPEQALGKRDEVDAQSDVWSVGAILFTLLTGQVVHPAPTIEGRLMAAASQRARSLKTVMPTLDQKILDVIDCALSFEKNRRFKTMRAMRDALFAQPAIAASEPVHATAAPQIAKLPSARKQPVAKPAEAPPAFGQLEDVPAFGNESEPPPGIASLDEADAYEVPNPVVALEPIIEREAPPPSVRHVSTQQPQSQASTQPILLSQSQSHLSAHTPQSHPPHSAHAPQGPPARTDDIDVLLEEHPAPAVPIPVRAARPMAEPTMLVRQKPPPKKWPWVVGILAVLVLFAAAGAGGALYWRRHHHFPHR